MPVESQFFQSVNYASFHEDGESERRALRLQASDRVLCLTGSGARPLDLLLDGPQEIVAIDWNPAQSHLLELKLTVIRLLDYDEGFEFVGLRPSTTRATVYNRIRTELSDAARTFWDARPKSIEHGFFFDGRWERFLRRASAVSRLTRRKLVQRVLNAKDIETQHTLWKEEWDNGGWRLTLTIASNRFIVKYIMREPGLQYIADDVRIGDVLRERFHQASNSFLFRESPWVWALFNGRIDESGPLPAHLRRENFAALRAGADRITITTKSLGDFLRNDENHFDAFSLSDFASYADSKTHADIWKLLIQRATANARFCERKFLVDYPLTAETAAAVMIDQGMTDTLNREDKSVVYTFLVAAMAD